MDPTSTDPTNESDASNAPAAPAEVPTPNTDQTTAQAATGATEQAPKKRKLLAPILVAAVLLLGGSAAAYNQVVLNSPEKIWEKSLNTTADGIREFTTIARAQQDQEERAYKVDGSFEVSGAVAADGSITGMIDGINSDISGEVGLLGLRLTGDIRTASINGSTTPNLYFRADGIDTVAGLLGLDTSVDSELTDALRQYNNQWFEVDRTLIGQLNTALEQDSDGQQFNDNDVIEFIELSADVLDQYLLSTNDDKAVFTIVESYGSEELDGADTYKYRVGVNKANLELFVRAYVEGVKDTAFIQTALEGTGQTLEEAIMLDDLLASIQDADLEEAQADVWVDKKRKFVRNVRFFDRDNPDKNYLDFALPYDGGDVLPFAIRFSGEDGEEALAASKVQAMFTAGYNKETQDIALSFDIDFDQEGASFAAKGTLTTESTDEELTVEQPTDAVNILDLLGDLDIQSLLNPTSSSDFDSFDDSDFFGADDFDFDENGNPVFDTSPDTIQL